MPPPLTIRAAQASDAETIAQFNEQIAQETEGKTLDPETIRTGVRALLDDPDRGFYLLAERGGRVVGSLMVTTEWSDWRNGTFWWVQSVYVHPTARRQGVYSSLYAEAKGRADDADHVCGLRLYVDKDNSVARETYEALGMTQTSYRMYEEEL